ncbi:MAG: AraC family transcriptional regulator [Verrucomicrobia bacterium]|nr:AraC family transcriptional regulator [Verrucomicrobiota bacterium]
MAILITFPRKPVEARLPACFPAREIALLKHKAKGRGFRTRLQRHAGHEIMCVDYGCMILRADQRILRLEPGDCFIIPPRVPHQIRGEEGMPFDFLNIIWFGKSMGRISNRALHLGAEARGMMMSLKQASARRLPHDDKLGLLKLNELLLRLDSMSDPVGAGRRASGENQFRYGNNVVQRAMAWLEANVSSPLATTRLAVHCAVSPSHLRALVRRVTGRTLRQHLRARRVEFARQLLHESADNVAAISQRVGYRSVPHFCTTFKRETGMTPSQFSRSLGKPEF